MSQEDFDEVSDLPEPPHYAGPADEDVDPLAPPDYADESPEVEGEEGDGGISDADRILRVWVEDGRLTKVRLSPVWFRRINGEDSLERHFAQALMLASVTVAAGVGEREYDGSLADPPTLPDEAKELLRELPTALTKRSVAVFSRLFAEADARQPAAPAESGAQPGRTGITGVSKGVTVRLNGAGRAIAVEFDQQWLDQAQVGTICSHVLLAAGRAYADYSPPAPPAVDEELNLERRALDAAFAVMLDPGRADR